MVFAFSACSRRIDMPVESRARQLQSIPVSRAAVRCAIYTRKSTDEGLDQAFNTLDAQREASESFINSQRHEGWTALPQKYDDGGYTGANMDRPALKRLLADVESGAVNCVVVYKVDRLTRSLLDFARIMEVLDKRGATFVSVTQQFNTTSSLGRLTLNILLSFAQFEREMISERTRDKMGAARRKGKWVGGNLVLGYDVAAQGGALVVNEDEARRVREIFRLYLEYGSLIPVIEQLDQRGWRLKTWTTREGREVGGSHFTKNKLYNLLTNVIYMGKVEYGGQIYEGEHPRIVEDETFNLVQETLHRNGRRGGRNVRNKYSALLKGIVRCATCDAGMIHTYTQKKNRLYRYYVCVRAHQRGWNQCQTRAVPAQALESAVVAQLRGIGRNPALLTEVMRQIAAQRDQSVAGLEKEKAALEQEMEKTSLEIGELAAVAGSKGAAAKSATDRLAELHESAERQERRLAELRREIAEAGGNGVDANDLDQALRDFDPLWEQMSTWEREKFIRALVEQVSYDGTTGTVTVGFRSAGVRSLCEYGTDQLH
jgi:site-specific DNA recombinase